MNEQGHTSKLDSIYDDTKMRTLEHLHKLKYAEDRGRIESDRIFQYLQQTIDCLQLCIDHLPHESAARQRYARYKDELGELGEEVIKLTQPHRW
ncbi:MAG: hypothetical protein ACRCW2_11425 [Cellulosilyticaceae bacterium]